MMKNERGYMLLTLVIAMSLVPMVVAVMSSHYQNMIGADGFLKRGMTRQQLSMVRNLSISSMKDIEGDGEFEPIKEGAANAIPSSFTVAGSDEWGTALKYYTWDLGAANGVNASYSQNNVAPPIAGLIVRIVSAGPDKTFQTTTAHAVAQGDDYMIDILKGDVLAYDGSGWTDDGPTVRLNNSSDLVGVGITPSYKLDVNGDISTYGWIRHRNSGEGLFNQVNGNHFYSESDKYWAITSNNTGLHYGGLRFRVGHAGPAKGFVYYDATSFGLLNSDGNWFVKGSPVRTDLYNPTYVNNADLYISGVAGTHGIVFADGTKMTTAPAGALKKAVYTVSGNWTAPAGVTTVYLSMVGGGGGGASISGNNGGGGGGGADGVISYPVAVVPGTVYAVIIGAGGAGASALDKVGSGGDATCFGAICVSGGNGGGEGTAYRAGGPRIGTGTAGAQGFNGIAIAGGGGASLLGPGGQPQHGTAIVSGTSAARIGHGGGYGGGGAGGHSGATAGNGSAGIVIIEW